MRLLEDHGKRLFREYGLRVPRGRTVTTPEEVDHIAGPMVLKALVPVGGRGKAGGVLKAATVEEARSAARRLLGMNIKGFRARSVLIEEETPMSREIYLSLTVDRSSGLPALLASPQGGVDIESLPDSAIARWTIHPFLGVQPHLVREAAKALGLQEYRDDLEEVLTSVWALFRAMDCELVEINPLALTDGGELVAADSKVIINDDALFRHPELGSQEQGVEGLEAEARSKDISFVSLDGDIGVIANGAGLTMATLDEIALRGGRGGAFLDLGGTDDPAKVEEAFKLMARAGPKAVLLNIFGGITKCDTVAQGVVGAMGRLDHHFPLVARIRGVNEEKARQMLRDHGIASHLDLEEAVREAVALEAGK
ncbi:succinate--CoA ligase subunit beta [Methanomassiliicoccus luminyensis]|uniref:succinate--CoA ligase subunit beta n=1 Tax=Methanomassiliicoccus luminyensis TaxID=1080712 RepID=UPI00037DB825|nr:ATP-grasp domain-containing protein [Methanomassiliicoccus luminyensis]